MGFVIGVGFGEALCRIFNLDSNKVKDIMISCPSIGTPTVDVRMYILAEEGDKLKEVLKQYKLEQKA